jgi:predicted dehydrogenase/threonine dehydrogenase-like Zn-dependent dehydrogenase
MKQVLQFRRSGTTRVVDVPAPLVPPGGLLVHNRYSLISPGTERMLVEAGGANLLNTARQRPELVRQVIDKARREGIPATLESVRSRLDVAVPLGYSSTGIILEVGDDVEGFLKGQRVACAGAGLANHAELIAVPKNLAVLLPETVSYEEAAFATVGAIALQGVRVADVKLGEVCVVIGLGLVGQLTVQLLKAAGCHVFGIDMAIDKVDLSRQMGADAGCTRTDVKLLSKVNEFTRGRGADAILITAATESSDPIELAPSLARDRAVVVAVGMIGMDVPRNAYYEKELQLRLSRSYGPGRYDKTYEQDGVDYPIGYVRWTEQRNMQAFLDLVADAKLRPTKLITHRIPIAEADRAYRIVTGQEPEPYMGILLEYPYAPRGGSRETRIELRKERPLEHAVVRLGVAGAGSFARSVLLPQLRKLPVDLRGVAASSGPSAHQTATRFGFGYASTEWKRIVDDSTIDAVLVATRHDLHPTIAAAALNAGKSVFLEKPMALSNDGLATIMDTWRRTGRILQVGFNRRFAPSYRWLKDAFAGRNGQLVMSFRVNAGSVSAGSWVVDPVQGGGRLLGEVCHMVDVLYDLAGAPVISVFAQPLPQPPSKTADDVLLTLTFDDGSMGTIVYASGGDRSLTKERLEVLGEGRAAVLDDFTTAEVHANGRVRRFGGRFPTQDKGHLAELVAFLAAVRAGGPSPVDPEGAAHVTQVTFAALESARTGLPVHL